jgi:hypothetical protein
MDAVGDECRGKAILAQLGKDWILVAVKVSRAAIAEMCGETSAGVGRLRNHILICHGMTNRDDYTFTRELCYERQRAANLGSQRHDSDQSVRGFLPATP